MNLEIYIALAANLLLFGGAWAFCVKIKNFSPVDAFWAASIGLTSLYFLLAGGNIDSRKIVAGLLIGIWAARLASHLFKRILKHHPGEDSRYGKLREHWVGRVNIMFLLFFLAQAISAFLLALPFYLVSLDTDTEWSSLHLFGALVASIGLYGEALSDQQMADFKATNHSSEAICKNGLWNYSRHPNYFFESVIWIGIFIFASGSPWGWVSLYAPVAITFLLLKVTGIPPTEASALKRKGSAYREYQRTTSAFIPLPPKK
ncbi:DUF1295 domain-containing protein [Luteolibacter algae]|uniref:DUF1295 domain-containing protein n=1 Tax=Luteolibacter algae TaxID=454151 RepID=A0ABW5D4F4_9BACT